MFRIFFQTLRFYWIHLTILEEMGSYLWRLESGFWTYGWMRFLGPSGPNVVSRLQVLSQDIFSNFMIYWIYLVILEKMRSCLWKLKPGLWTYDWICLLGPSGTKVVSRSQTPKSRYFLRFHYFIGFISWFLKKCGPACENWSQGSEPMAGYVLCQKLWAQIALN